METYGFLFLRRSTNRSASTLLLAGTSLSALIAISSAAMGQTSAGPRADKGATDRVGPLACITRTVTGSHGATETATACDGREGKGPTPFNVANPLGALGIGYNVRLGQNDLVLGSNAFGNGNSTTIGNSAFSFGENTVAVGSNAEARAFQGTALGEAAKSLAEQSTSIGAEAQAGLATDAVASDRTKESLRGKRSTAIGFRALTLDDDGTAMGAHAQAGLAATAIGPKAKAGFQRSVAIGDRAETTADYQFMFGTAENAYVMPGLSNRARRELGADDGFVFADPVGRLSAVGYDDVLAKFRADLAKDGATPFNLPDGMTLQGFQTELQRIRDNTGQHARSIADAVDDVKARANEANKLVADLSTRRQEVDGFVSTANQAADKAGRHALAAELSAQATKEYEDAAKKSADNARSAVAPVNAELNRAKGYADEAQNHLGRTVNSANMAQENLRDIEATKRGADSAAQEMNRLQTAAGQDGAFITEARIRVLEDKDKIAGYATEAEGFKSNAEGSANAADFAAREADEALNRAKRGGGGTEPKGQGDQSGGDAPGIAAVNARLGVNDRAVSKQVGVIGEINSRLGVNDRAVTTQGDRLGAVNTRLGANDRAVTTQGDKIGEVNTRLGVNDRAVTTQGEKIGGVNTRLGINDRAVTTQGDKIGEVNTRLGVNDRAVTTQGDKIGEVNTRLGVNDRAVTTQGEKIGGVNTRLGVNDRAVATQGEKIGAVNTRLGVNHRAVEKQGGRITVLNGEIKTNGEAIGRQTTTIAEHEAILTGNGKALDSHGKIIENHKSRLDGHDDDITGIKAKTDQMEVSNGNVALGTSDSTHSLRGVTSQKSTEAQKGEVKIVTTDQDGNLAARDFNELFTSAALGPVNARIGTLEHGMDILSGRMDRLDHRMDRAEEGIAMAMAMATVLPAFDKYAFSANMGGFGDKQAMAFTAAARMLPNLIVSSGLGVSAQSGYVSYRFGVAVAM